MLKIHWHDPQPIAVETYDTPFIDSSTGQILESRGERLIKPQTRILLRCECGYLKTENIDGRWTLEQVKGM